VVHSGPNNRLITNDAFASKFIFVSFELFVEDLIRFAVRGS
jgi:hypothetical protein